MAGRLRDLASQYLLSLYLVQPTPNTVGFADAEGVVETGPTDGAGRADGFGSGLSGFFLVLALEVGGREKNRGLWPPTGRFGLPQIIDSLNAQRDPPFFRES
jgi:hypothetical protein